MERMNGSESDLSKLSEKQSHEALNPNDPGNITETLSWAKRNTFSLDRNPKETLGEINRHSVAVFGREVGTNEPYVGVVGPQIQTKSPEALSKVKNLLTRKGLTAINILASERKISDSEAQKLRLEMSLGGVGIDFKVQNGDSLFKKPVRKDEEQTLISGKAPVANSTEVTTKPENSQKKLSRRQFLKQGVVFVSGLALASCSIVPVAPAAANPDVSFPKETATTLPSTATATTEPTPEKTPTVYRVEASGGAYSEAQIKINESQSVIDQKSRIQRWLDYWIHFENRPFAPDSTEITWKYIYDNIDNPTEVFVLIETLGGGYGNKLFGVPIAGGKFADYPPQLAESEDFIKEGLGPLEVSAGDKGLWLSVQNGVLVRKDSEGKVIERVNMQTGEWMNVEVIQMDKVCIDWRKVETEGTLITMEDVTSGRLTETAKDVAKELGMESFPETVNTKGKLTLSKRGNDSRLLYVYKTSTGLDENYQEYLNNPESRPYRWLMFNRIRSPNSNEVFVIATQQRENPDKSISYVHYVPTNKLDNNYLYRVFVSNPFPLPFWSAKCLGGDYPICEFQDQEVLELIQKWKDSRSVPNDLQNKTMLITDLVLKQ